MVQEATPYKPDAILDEEDPNRHSPPPMDTENVTVAPATQREPIAQALG